jgi:hypothetical protein
MGARRKESSSRSRARTRHPPVDLRLAGMKVPAQFQFYVGFLIPGGMTLCRRYPVSHLACPRRGSASPRAPAAGLEFV